MTASVAQFPPAFDVELDGVVLTIDLAELLTVEEFAAHETSGDATATIALGLSRAAAAAGVAMTFDEARKAVAEAFVAMTDHA